MEATAEVRQVKLNFDFRNVNFFFSPQQQGSPSYPGVHSLKRIKVSPPKPGQLYPQLVESADEDPNGGGNGRPETVMSGESAAPSEAPSLGAAIQRAANAQR